MFSEEASLYYIFFSLIFLIASLSLTGLKSAIHFLGPFQTKEFFSLSRYRFFPFRFFLKKLFHKREWEALFITLSITRIMTQVCYATLALLFILSFYTHITALAIVLSIIYLLLITVFCEYLMRFLAVKFSKKILNLLAVICSLFLILLFFLSYPLTKFLFLFVKKRQKRQLPKKVYISKEKVLQLLQDLDLSYYFDSYDQKIIASFITFREKVAREIMVPRINLCCLSSDTTIREAAKEFVNEGYSRIPIYKDSLDNILGVLMSKDVMEIFSLNDQEESKNLLNMLVYSIIKPVIYAPENKKISYLFQEFRAKQSHIAIIVNEYGGTEGIVTIEDILEELVGEIEDEYDVNEEEQFWKMPNGSWIVDAKMSIIDLENHLNISIPHNPEYETIGGYIFHRAGTIPTKGWKIHLDNYELEVLISNERCIEKIRITPTNEKKE